jgi:hypothetical protein
LHRSTDRFWGLFERLPEPVQKSALVKKSLFELYENVMDLDEIKKFETKEQKGKSSFFTAEDILKK